MRIRMSMYLCDSVGSLLECMHVEQPCSEHDFDRHLEVVSFD